MDYVDAWLMRTPPFAANLLDDHMQSIKARLIAWIVSVLLLVMGGTGLVAYRNAQASEESDYQAQKDSLLQRLSLSLPHALWQLDEEFIRLTLNAELRSPIVVGLRISGEAGVYQGQQRLADGSLGVLPPNSTPVHDEVVSRPVLYQQRESLGTLQVFLSRQRIQQHLQHALLQQVLQALLVAAALSTILILLLRSYVFSPLQQLQLALQLANEQQHAPQLPEARFRELTALVRGVNTIVRKISDELTLRRDAETIAIAEKERSQQAYRQLLETQDTLIRTEKLASLGGLVAGVAHEINTPVGISLTTASHLAGATKHINQQFTDGQIKKSELLEYLQTAQEASDLILANAERAANLIHSFKQVAVDQTSEARRSFDLGEYLHEIVTSLGPKLKRSRVVVEIDCPDELQMDSYPGALSQVITNLIMNTLLHAYDEQQEGTLLLRADLQSGQQIRLQVCDDGKGIAPEHLPHIFDPFFTTRRGSGGSGLGLHIVFNIVFKRLGGNIKVDSTLGEGTRFTLAQPCHAPQAQCEEAL